MSIRNHARVSHGAFRKWGAPLALFLAGLALMLGSLQSELLWFPPDMDTISRMVYRAVFLVVLPMRVLVNFVIPRVDHHWPLAHHIVSTLGAPFAYYAAWRLIRMAAGGRRCFTPALWRPPSAGIDLGRRQFLLRSAAGGFGAATLGLSGYAAMVEPSQLSIRRYTMPIPGLPREFDGLRILHFSDSHYGPYTAATFIREAIHQANNLEPDIMLLTGDYVHHTPLSVQPGINLLRNLECRFGRVAVMGNHEHWEGAVACRLAFDAAAIPLVDNRRLFLTPEGLSETPEPRYTLCIAGVGDLWEDEVNFDKATGGLPHTMPRIVLSHNPDTAELVPENVRLDLMLSGHTHGGQVSLPLVGAPIAPTRYGAKYLGGLCQGPRCPVIVSRGIGLAGIPVRFCVPPELGLITLRRA